MKWSVGLTSESILLASGGEQILPYIPHIHLSSLNLCRVCGLYYQSRVKTLRPERKYKLGLLHRGRLPL